MMMRGAFGGSRGSSSRCQDCGNQAKRDCAYMRCRTCCKTKGFECQTHIKSTWLPASASAYGRSQKHHQNLLLHDHQLQLLPNSASASAPPVHQQYNPKRPRENPSTGLFEEEITGRNFPAAASFPALLRCIRVSSIDDSITHYAYQTAVSIGGHVFKGILYDQGLNPTAPDHFSSSAAAVGPAMAEPHQPNLSNIAAQYQALMASTSSADHHRQHDHDEDQDHEIVACSCPLVPGMQFFQHSSPSPKCP